MGKHPSRPAGQEGEEGELLGRQLDAPPADGDLMAGDIDSHVAHLQHRLVDGFPGLAGRGPVAERDPHPGQQLGHGEGLGDVVVRPLVEGQHLAGVGALGRPDDDGQVGPAPDAAAHLHPVDVGQVEVEHDQGGRLQGGDVDRLLAGDGGQHPVAAGLQSRPQRPQDGRLVVDHQDRLDRPHGAHGQACRAGRVKAKVAPPPGVRSTRMRPPWASTTAFQMASPTPLDRLPPPRRNGSNTRSRSQSGTPMPSSATQTST